MKRRAMFIAVLIVVGAVTIWGAGHFSGDKVAAQLDELRREMSNESLPPNERETLQREFRERIGSLSEAQRDAYFESRRDEWIASMNQRMDEFFALAPAQQRERLDSLIDRSLRGGQGPRFQGGGERPGGGRSLTEAERDARAKRRLDRSTPKMRAQRDEFRRMMKDRVETRGIDPDSLRRRWRGAS